MSWSSDRRPEADGLSLLSGLFPAWQKQAACLGQGPERWYPTKQGDPAFEGKAICAGCPVLAECLDAAVVRDEEYGIHGGAGEAERRTFRRVRRDRPHGLAEEPGCTCGWCTELTRHRTNLTAIASGVRVLGNPGDRNGPGVTHGRRYAYARGCRCAPCRWSASANGQRLAAVGEDTAAWWAMATGDDHERRAWLDARAWEFLGNLLHSLMGAMAPGLIDEAELDDALWRRRWLQTPEATALTAENVNRAAWWREFAGTGSYEQAVAPVNEATEVFMGAGSVPTAA